MHDKLKSELGRLFDQPADNVDVFSLVDFKFNNEPCVKIRYNIHGSPYYSAAKLNGLLSQRKSEVRIIV